MNVRVRSHPTPLSALPVGVGFVLNRAMDSAAAFDDEGRYVAVTEGITVRVKPVFLPRQSDPDNGRWVWAYEITIENGAEEPVQLLNRHWDITDAHGHLETVDGPGVVGEQPVIEPGRGYTYASGCPLGTSSGFMGGHFEMSDTDGRRFNIQVPTFSLDLPAGDRALN